MLTFLSIISSALASYYSVNGSDRTLLMLAKFSRRVETSFTALPTMMSRGGFQVMSMGGKITIHPPVGECKFVSRGEFRGMSMGGIQNKRFSRPEFNHCPRRLVTWVS